MCINRKSANQNKLTKDRFVESRYRHDWLPYKRTRQNKNGKKYFDVQNLRIAQKSGIVIYQTEEIFFLRSPENKSPKSSQNKIVKPTWTDADWNVWKWRIDGKDSVLVETNHGPSSFAWLWSSKEQNKYFCFHVTGYTKPDPKTPKSKDKYRYISNCAYKQKRWLPSNYQAVREPPLILVWFRLSKSVQSY